MEKNYYFENLSWMLLERTDKVMWKNIAVKLGMREIELVSQKLKKETIKNYIYIYIYVYTHTHIYTLKHFILT